MHLISKHRYPVIANPSLETIVSFLMEAPKIVGDLQPVQWQFLDAPPDGSVLLTWQPLAYLGNNFASDGYVWADAEQPFTSEVGGYRLEIIMHRSGYKASGEPVACHSRKRYRLLPGNPQLGLPTPDPALWIVHYTRAASRDHIPAASIPIQPQVQASLQQRRIIQTQGQLARKEFMLNDKANWPVVNLPAVMSGRPASGGAMVPGGGHRRGGSMNAPVGELSIEEEEDVSRGDALDLVTPREISRMRYEQHHEWMEEIVESAYSIKQIIPSDLGLGRKGELESLTRGFFDAPMSAATSTTNGAPARVGKMDVGKAEEFTKLAAQKVADMQKELGELKAKHARRMEKLQQTSVLAVAEKKLRTANDGSEPGDGGEKQESGASTDDIVRDVEVAWGRKIDRVQNVTIVQRGGLEDLAPRLQSGMSARTMSGASPTKLFTGGSFSQGTPGPEPRQSPMMQQQQGFQQQQMPPQPRPTPPIAHLAEPPMVVLAGQQAIPSIASESTVQSTGASQPPPPVAQEGAGVVADTTADADADSMDLGDDIDIDELVNQGEEANADTDNQDWIMVDENATKTPENAQEEAQETSSDAQSMTEQAPTTENQLAPPAAAEEVAPLSNEEAVTTEQPVADQQAPEEQAADLQDSVMEADDLGLDDEFDDVGDMDTAGDALAAYGGDDLDLDTMDDSAFGDAFHPADD
jgi:Fungal domain of unknown function (DUF1750)